MEEIWKDIPEYEGLYQASNLGRVRSLDRLICNKNKVISRRKSKIFNQKKGSNGYINAVLIKNGKNKTYTIHSLIAITFLGHKINGYKKVINHKDLDKLNNKIDNLEITTQRKNSSFFRLNKTSKYIGVSKYKNKWAVLIRHKGKHIFLGYFKCEIEASECYNNAVLDIEKGKEITKQTKTINKSSKYKNVCYIKNIKKWKASLTINGRYFNLGVFNNEEEAKNTIDNFKKTM